MPPKTRFASRALPRFLAMALGLTAGVARGETVYQLSLPLTDKASTTAVVTQQGGQLSGGQFGPGGWTTTTRGDFIDVPLPYQLDTSEGKLVLSVANFEMSPPFSSHFWHFYLVVLDPFGAQTPSLPPWGHAHVGAGHRGYWDAGPDHAAIAYWNLFDPMCSDWMLCTTETGTGGNFITGAAKVTWTFQWSGAAVWVTFEGGGKVNKMMDLGSTSPSGVFREDQLVLSINNCGGSGSLLCGSWDEPNNRGGPIGVTYSDVELEIYGTVGQGGAGGGGGAGEGGSGGTGGAGGAGPAVGGTGGEAGGAGGGGAVTGSGGAAGGDNGALSGSCACRGAAASAATGWTWGLALLAFGLAVRRCRAAAG